MKKYGMLMFGILALVGTFFPVAKSGLFSISIINVGGISYLLYVIPLAAIALSIIVLHKENIQNIKIYYTIVAGMGLGICVYTMYQGMELSKLASDVAINAFALRGVKKAISAMPAGGGWMMMLGYCGIIAYLRTGIYDTNKEQEQC